MTGAAEVSYSGPPVKTFVFLDLETTGLPGPGRRPRVVELSVVAIHRQNLVTPCQGDEPRVLDKLTLCVYPMRNIDPGASAVTGLYTDAVYPLKDLDDNFVQSLDLFLRRHEAPICLVAHNGNKFDFPLLQSELMSLGKELPGDILCVDSLLAFRDIEGGIIIPPARELSDSVTEAKGSPPSNSTNARPQETPQKLSDNAASSSIINDARPQETPCKLPDNAASSSENIVSRDVSDTNTESNQKRQRLNPRRLDFAPPENQTNTGENQTNPAENQTNPAENQTNPAANQTNPAENQTNTSENQTNTAENHTNTAENQTNTESKRQRLNPRRLDFTPAGNQTNTEDFNCNVLEEVTDVNTGSPEGPPLLHDPLPSGSDWTHVIPELGNRKPSVVRRLTLEDNPVKTRSESLSEMSDDTLPFIGDNENETMSTLQQMSTFVYTGSESSLGAGDQLSACSSKITSLSSLDSQKTVTYPLDMEQSDSTSQSIPDRNQMSSLTDSELGEMEIPGDNQISMMEIPDQNHAAVKNIEIPNSPKRNGISPSENGNHPSESTPGSETLRTDVQNSVNNQTNGFSHKEFPSKPHGIPVSNHDSPPCTPSREECPPELKEQLAKLGTHAPRKNPPGKAVSRRQNPTDRGFKPYEARLSYKLSVLHKRVLGYAPPRSHSAEDDAMALLRLFHREATSLLPWADTHAVPLNSIPLLYAVKRRNPLPDGTFPQYL